MKNSGVLFAILGVLVLLFLSAFTVSETQLAIKFKFGEIVSTDLAPGLHFQWPLVNNVRRFEKRIVTLDAKPERFLTSEKKDVRVDFFVKWRIGNVANFYRATKGDFSVARQRLSSIMIDGLRNEFAIRSLVAVVSEQRSNIVAALKREASEKVVELGMEVIDVRIKKIELPDEVSASVFQRMRSERERVANDLRARGKEAGERIKADADKQAQIIVAEALRDAEKTRGEGDAESARIYADAYGQDREFYRFYRSLQAYRSSFASGKDMLVLDPDSEFFRYLKNDHGK